MDCQSKKVMVIGAGVSGLAAACQLKKQGFSVKVVDKAQRAGGVISTFSQDGFYAESGSNVIFIQSSTVLDFIYELGLSDKLQFSSKAAKKRYFVRSGEMLALPTNPFSMIFTKLLSFAGKIRIFKEISVPAHDFDSEVSVSQFMADRFGQEFCDYIINPFMGGIYASSPDRLSVKYAMPKVWQIEQKYGSLIKGAFCMLRELRENKTKRFKSKMASFKGGMQTFIDAMAAYLGGDLSVNCKVLSIDYNDGKWDILTEEGGDSYDEIVFAVPAHKIKNVPITGNMSVALGSFNEIEYAPIATLTLGFDLKQFKKKPQGFGVLVPQKENMSILGSLFLSSIFPDRAPENCCVLTNYFGGFRNPEMVEKPIEELVELACKDLQKLMGLKGAPKFAKLTVWKKGIAQYNIGYDKFIEAKDEFEKQYPNIKLVGSYMGGVGVGKCVENALQAVSK